MKDLRELYSEVEVKVTHLWPWMLVCLVSTVYDHLDGNPVT
jgi:hypothetical protein